MRTNFVAAAVILASVSVAAPSFADDTSEGTTAPPTVTTPLPGSPPAVPSTTQSSMTTTPVAPSTTPGVTSTTTTTAADTEGFRPLTTPSTNADAVTVYDRRRPNRPLLITGALVLAGTYATTAAIAANADSVRDHDLYIPIVGPWINIASRSTDVPDNTRDTVLIAGSGVLQGVGALMAITSFFVPEKVPIATIAAGPVKMHLTPTAGAGTGGVGAFGTF